MSDGKDELNKSSKYEIKMTEGPVFSKMLKFAIPLIFSGLLQLLFNAADIIVVGRFAGEVSDASLAAVGAAAAPVNLVVNLLIGLSTGVNVCVAKAFGAGRERDIHEAVHTSILMAVIGGIIMTAVGLSISSFLLKITGTPPEVLPLSKKYMDILYMGIPVMALYNFGSGIFRARGDTKRPLYYLFAAGVVNIGLNLFFVIVLKMAVVGVALATVLSQILSMVLIMGTLMREKGAFRLELKKLRLYPSKVRPIVIIGIPAGIQGMLFSISNMVIQSSINSFGKIAMAGSAAASSLEGFTFTTMDAFSQSAVTFTSQNVGAGRMDRVPTVFKAAILLVTAAGIIFGMGTYLLGRPLLGIYTKNPKVVYQGMKRLALICIPYFICGIMNVIPSVARGMGYSVVPTIVTVIGVCALRIVWIHTICALPPFSSIEWVYASYSFSWVVTVLAHLVYLSHIFRKNGGQSSGNTALA